MGNKPRIRFKGFTEDWEQRKFSDIFAEVKSGLSRMLSNDDIGLPVVRANNINDGQLNLADDIKYWYKNDPQGANTNNYLIDQGDILIHFINSEAKMGTAAYVTRRPERDTIYTTNILRCKVNDEYNSYFIYSLTFLNSYKNYIASITKPAVNQASFTSVDFKKYSIKIPTEKEQNQIANLIETFNQLITLHQCKLEKLKLTKKALLQKLFPKNGKHIPEIRFKGFTDAWEQRKFSDITYLSGVKNKENKPYESYSISNEFGFIPQDEQFENGGTMKTANKSMYYIVSQNSFAYNPARINVGSIGYYDKPDNVIVSSLYEVFKTTEIVNDKFLWHWFKSSQFNHLIEKYQEGGVRLYFYYDKLCKGTIELPTINEQNKISNLLDSLDMYITLHQQEPFLCGNSVNGGVELC